MKIYKKNLNGL